MVESELRTRHLPAGRPSPSSSHAQTADTHSSCSLRSGNFGVSSSSVVVGLKSLGAPLARGGDLDTLFQAQVFYIVVW